MEQAKKISTAVLEFMSYKLGPEGDGEGKFYIQELRSYVAARVPSQANAWDPSADRILRKLRLQNKINYVVLNRNASLYQVLPMSEGNA